MIKRSYIITLVLVVLFVVVGIAGWRLGQSSNSDNTKSKSPSTSTSNVASTNVTSIVSYTLPDGWNEGTCPSASNVIYISPNGTSLDCSTNPSSSVKIYVDSQSTTDCQQLAPSTNVDVRKHVCISLYINGHKSLKSSTEYSNGSAYKTDTTISTYYINTGKGVVTFQYTYTSTNNFQYGFEQMAMSVKVK